MTSAAPAPPEAAEVVQEPLSRYLRALTRKPFSNVGDYLRLRRVVTDPLRLLAIRHYKGPPYPTRLELTDGRVLGFRAGTMDRHVVWSVLVKDVYCLGSLPAGGRLGTVVDVGGQIGTFSVAVAPRAERVLTFEPAPENHALLAANVARNGFTHVTTYERAVSDRPGELVLYRSASNTGGHSMLPSISGGETERVSVPCVRLPDVLAEQGVERIGLLKLDCEGAEYEALISLEDWGLERVERMIVEYHRRPDEDPERFSGEGVERRLQAAGFGTKRLPSTRHEGLGLIFAEQTASGGAWLARAGHWRSARRG